MRLDKVSSGDNCPICWNSMEGTDCIGHGTKGACKSHRDCLESWAKASSPLSESETFSCPGCRGELSKASLLTNEIRFMRELQAIKNDMYEGAKCSLLPSLGGITLHGSHLFSQKSNSTLSFVAIATLQVALFALAGSTLYATLGFVKRHYQPIT